MRIRLFFLSCPASSLLISADRNCLGPQFFQHTARVYEQSGHSSATFHPTNRKPRWDKQSNDTVNRAEQKGHPPTHTVTHSYSHTPSLSHTFTLTQTHAHIPKHSHTPCDRMRADLAQCGTKSKFPRGHAGHKKAHPVTGLCPPRL